ncbi:hypothetical protein [Lacipirellula parvula]|uniref:Carboxypeptidase regulatory-like domain-containing protein n=1 Tax=Lacipirellula parvula TaxID=2650471 RepID=A0A5K7X4R3_9BACT|nr:hypothetical protein [Lacipirellula parvula]BBO30802.1 hypothetical protein PLANPX_0414 [Lacipirellula parvula]
MIRTTSHRRTLALAIALACCFGCGGPTKHGVQGIVTLDGQPLSEARILFVPTAEGQKKTGCLVKDGTYRLLADVGLLPGRYQVQIVDDPPDVDPDLPTAERKPRRPLPELYAAATPLQVEVDEQGGGDFDFELNSPP